MAELPNSVELSCLLPSEAEHIVASVWRALVAYDITTPRLSVRSAPGGLLDLGLEFGTVQEAERIRAALGSKGPPQLPSEINAMPRAAVGFR